jgi:hypothetical protein
MERNADGWRDAVLLGWLPGISLWRDFENQLSPAASLGHFPSKSIGCPAEREHGVHDGPQTARLYQIADFGQLFVIRFDDEERLFHPFFRVALISGSNSDHAPLRFEHLPGAIESFAPDCVEYYIDSREAFFESVSAIVDDLVGP